MRTSRVLTGVALVCGSLLFSACSVASEGATKDAGVQPVGGMVKNHSEKASLYAGGTKLKFWWPIVGRPLKKHTPFPDGTVAVGSTENTQVVELRCPDFVTEGKTATGIKYKIYGEIKIGDVGGTFGEDLENLRATNIQMIFYGRLTMPSGKHVETDRSHAVSYPILNYNLDPTVQYKTAAKSVDVNGNPRAHVEIRAKFGALEPFATPATAAFNKGFRTSPTLWRTVPLWAVATKGQELDWDFDLPLAK